MSTLPPFVRHSETSREAAIEAKPNAGTQRARVFDALRQFPTTGLTDHQIQLLLDMNPSTQRPRRVELVNAGLVIDSGMTRLTPSGRKAVVWIIRKEEFGSQVETRNSHHVGRQANNAATTVGAVAAPAPNPTYASDADGQLGMFS